MFSICQSIGDLPIDFKNEFVLENGLLLKKPLYAESGLGWAPVIIKWLGLVIKLVFFMALFPQSIKTTGSFFSFIN